MKAGSSIMMRIKLWQLRRVIGRIRSIEADSLEHDKSIDELISQETNSETKSNLKECRKRMLSDEQATFRNLHERATAIYKELKETTIGTHLLLANKITAEFLYVGNKDIAAAEPSKDIKALFSAFQFSWKIVQLGILLTVLSFGLAQVLLVIGIPTPFAFEKIGAVFFMVTFLAAVAHSLISVVASYTMNKAKPVWSFIKTLAFETVLIALYLLFFCGLFLFTLFEKLRF